MSADTLKTCGIIMPISSCSGYTEEHWVNVLNIIKEAISNTGNFAPVPVWLETKTDVIHSTIISNIIKCDIIVCDMSTNNPNVMYELGLRMTMRKPVVIIKDDVTKTPFDTNVLRYEQYPKDLHYFKIEAFIKKLSEIITDTWKKYSADPENFTQLINLDDYKKYKIVTASGEVEEQTVQDAIKSIYQMIRKSTHNPSAANIDLTELSSAKWEVKSARDAFKKTFKEIKDKLLDDLNHSDSTEAFRTQTTEQIDSIMMGFEVFEDSLESLFKAIEDVVNG
ncbi:MAG TPA: hypothetical protein H9796_13650 [Candidatus Butyricimonas faecavium]|nr:hypothetical protein [Candidatus Butyricimonas faecavium]